jgi:transposase-like protein
MKRNQRGVEFWQQLKAAHDAGEGNYAQLAAREGVSRSSVYAWIKRLRSGAETSSKEPVRMLPVTLTPMAFAGLEVELARYRLRFAAGADPRYIAAVVRALVAA